MCNRNRTSTGKTLDSTEADITADAAAPRVLYIDDGTFHGQRCHFPSLPVSSKTVVFLRNPAIGTREDLDDLDPCHLVVENRYTDTELIGDSIYQFRRLETLVLPETDDEHFVSAIFNLPSFIRRVHILQHYIHIDNIDVDHPGVRRRLPHLESFTFTLFQTSANSESQTSAGNDLASNTPAELQQAVESLVDAPQCTFKYLQTTKSPEEALADALAESGLDS